MNRLNRLKVMVVFGTRPEAIKMAPVVQELQNHPEEIEPVVAVTAQHREMLDQVLDLFGIAPQYDLGIMQEGQTLSEILIRTIEGLEEVLKREVPDLTLVHGDTATTFGGSLASFYQQIPVGHVEAGLRTEEKYDPFPEEMNRRLTGAIADLHFAPLHSHKSNLLAENVGEEGIFITGNTVIDALLAVASRDIQFAGLGVAGRRTILVTVHRRESLGEPLANICLALRDLARTYGDVEIVFPVHRNPRVQETVYSILGEEERVRLLEPVDYQTMVGLMKACFMVITDSGGLQEEAPALDKPVLVTRDVTERPEGVEAGTLKLVGRDRGRILQIAGELLDNREEYERMARAVNPYGDGKASRRIVEAILYHFGRSKERPEEFMGGLLRESRGWIS